jgi:hypothetical protein
MSPSPFLALHVNELRLIRYNVLLFLTLFRVIRFNLTVWRKVRNIEAFSLSEWVLPPFTSLDHRRRRNNTLWIEIKKVVAGICISRANPGIKSRYSRQAIRHGMTQ